MSQSKETRELVLAAKRQAERLAGTLDAIWWRLRMEPIEHNGLATLEDAKLAHILRVVEVCGGNITKAARILRVNPKTIYNVKRRASHRLEVSVSSRSASSYRKDK